MGGLFFSVEFSGGGFSPKGEGGGGFSGHEIPSASRSMKNLFIGFGEMKYKI